MTFAYDIMVCVRNIISTISNIMSNAQDTKAFAYDTMVCIHNIISTASNIMSKHIIQWRLPMIQWLVYVT